VQKKVIMSDDNASQALGGARPPETIERHGRVGELSERLRHRVDHTLHSRFARPDTLVGFCEDRSKRAALQSWKAAKRWPSAAALLSGGLMLLAADAIGVGEIAIAIGLGCAIYEVLTKNVPLPQALRDVSKID
jgi:hypothetical protein